MKGMLDMLSQYTSYVINFHSAKYSIRELHYAPPISDVVWEQLVNTLDDLEYKPQALSNYVNKANIELKKHNKSTVWTLNHREDINGIGSSGCMSFEMDQQYVDAYDSLTDAVALFAWFSYTEDHQESAHNKNYPISKQKFITTAKTILNGTSGLISVLYRYSRIPFFNDAE